ncbi:hypothetical protein M8C21_011105 [Ambrosia artemisiifolia]|uniref:Uncharacterized protein n=1 Tax=Ambrosia artemisiifolia TaxID=4212 RepID=A0AAD5D9G4_AMBAR|nr:hypothetical protein M8C21_011105 [Ambrosia artemisiifolia]
MVRRYSSSFSKETSKVRHVTNSRSNGGRCRLLGSGP